MQKTLVTPSSDHIEIVREINNIVRCSLRGEEKVEVFGDGGGWRVVVALQCTEKWAIKRKKGCESDFGGTQ